MGMFDSLYDAAGIDWQTKALARNLDRYNIGDPIPGPPLDYQMKVLGETNYREFVYLYATIRNGVVSSLPDERDESMPLLDYSGDWIWEGK